MQEGERGRGDVPGAMKASTRRRPAVINPGLRVPSPIWRSLIIPMAALGWRLRWLLLQVFLESVVRVEEFDVKVVVVAADVAVAVALVAVIKVVVVSRVEPPLR